MADPITVLLPTYGRFARLRESLAYFDAQDYAGETRLLILNDGPPLTCDARGVEVWNVDGIIPTLALKRQMLLERAQTPLVAVWDDDCWYLPWHLTDAAAGLVGGRPVSLPWWTYYLDEGDPDSIRKVARFGYRESMMAADRAGLMAEGGWPQQLRGAGMKMIERLHAERKVAWVRRPRWRASIVKTFHAQGMSSEVGARGPATFHERNTDFGDGSMLTPGDIRPKWRALVDLSRAVLKPSDVCNLQSELLPTEPS